MRAQKVYGSQIEAMAALQNKRWAETRGRKWMIGVTDNGWYVVVEDK